MMEGMTTPPRTPESTAPPPASGTTSGSPRRGPNGRFVPRSADAPPDQVTLAELAETADQVTPAELAETADQVTPARPVLTSAGADPTVIAESFEDSYEQLPEDRFLNRELSWLDFNTRVLALAEDPEV